MPAIRVKERIMFCLHLKVYTDLDQDDKFHGDWKNELTKIRSIWKDSIVLYALSYTPQQPSFYP